MSPITRWLIQRNLTCHDISCIHFFRDQPVDVASTVAEERCRRHVLKEFLRSQVVKFCTHVFSSYPGKLTLSVQRAKWYPVGDKQAGVR